MFTKEDEISLVNLAEGAGIELFDLDLIKVIKNIEDPNNQIKFKREINLVVEFTPTDAKGMVDVKIGVKTKLAARNVVSTNVIYGRDPLSQKLEAREFISQQRDLPGFPTRDGDVKHKKNKETLQ
jgi:hypothetical protein